MQNDLIMLFDFWYCMYMLVCCSLSSQATYIYFIVNDFPLQILMPTKVYLLRGNHGLKNCTSV